MKNKHLSILAAASVVALTLAATPAFAQCDSATGTSTASSTCKAQEQSSIQSMTQQLKSEINTQTNEKWQTIKSFLDSMDKGIIGKLDWWWNNLGNKKDSSGNTDSDAKPALQTMIQQLHSGIVDQSRQRLTDQDADNTKAVARQQAVQEYQATKTYQPTNQTCQFDTVSTSLGRSSYVSRALTTGYALDFNKIGQGDKNSPAANGPDTLQKARYDIYKSKFCDPNQNAGHAGCASGGSPNPDLVNADVQPSKTVFGNYTIDMTQEDNNTAVSQLLFNITGYDAPVIITPSALKSSAGLQQRQKNREYIAQMDAVMGLAGGVVAERAPGEENLKIKEMRDKMGIQDASRTPSHREIRQAIVEQLWDPGYYIELGDSPSTLTQKELYLKAYALVMMYDIIAKQEKISTAYAIETANMLEKLGAGRGGAVTNAPVR